MLIDELFTPLMIEETFYTEAKYVIGNKREELVSGAILVPASELIRTVQVEPGIFRQDMDASKGTAAEVHI